MNSPSYRGRLAPSPTGFLHLGHARTFWLAQERARAAGGTLILRNEDLDPQRSKPKFVAAMIEDLHWFGFEWQEGPDVGGPFAPYSQSERRDRYAAAFRHLVEAGFIYPCRCSRKDLQRAASAPNFGDDELVYPGTCRPTVNSRVGVRGSKFSAPTMIENLGAAASQPETRNSNPAAPSAKPESQPVAWRFRVPDGETIAFTDHGFGPQRFVAGRDFGDFVVWTREDVPAYQLAVVVDDAAMRINEVVRGADLLVSTARQWLLYRALGLVPPAFFHAPLVTDTRGARLAKRHDALSLRALRARGESPEAIRAELMKKVAA